MNPTTEIKRRKFAPYFIMGLVAFYFGHLCAKLYIQSPNGTPLDPFQFVKLEYVLDRLLAFQIFDFNFTFVSIEIGLIGVFIVMLFYLKVQRTGYFRRGEEHGSARYSFIEELRGFMDDIFENNIILSQRLRLGIWNKRLPFQFQSNKNIFVIGGSGDGKTFTFVLPNALQLNASKLFTDTKGVLIHQLGKFYRLFRYKVKVFDLIHFTNSNQFNPFVYMRSELDIDRVASAIVNATKKSDNQGEDFWVQAELLLMRALIGYVYFDSQLSHYTATLPQVADMVRYIRREDPEIESPVELMFKALEEAKPGNYACKQWDLFNKNYDGETRTSLLAIIAARFSVFDHDDVRKLLERDTMDITQWQKEKYAIFINIPETNTAYQFISSLLFSTIFDTCIRVADDIIKGDEEAPKGLNHLQMIMDELPQIGKIPDFEKYMAVIRSREISTIIPVQSESQMVKLYGKEDSKTILNNCATKVYLGTQDQDTADSFSKRAGNQTIQDDNYSQSRGIQSSSSTQQSKLKRELLDSQEIMTLPVGEVLVFLNRQKAFRDNRAEVSQHPYAKYVADDKDNPNWYRFTIPMSDIDEFLENVKKEDIVTIDQSEIDSLKALAS